MSRNLAVSVVVVALQHLRSNFDATMLQFYGIVIVTLGRCVRNVNTNLRVKSTTIV